MGNLADGGKENQQANTLLGDDFSKAKEKTPGSGRQGMSGAQIVTQKSYWCLDRECAVREFSLQKNKSGIEGEIRGAREQRFTAPSWKSTFLAEESRGEKSGVKTGGKESRFDSIVWGGTSASIFKKKERQKPWGGGHEESEMLHSDHRCAQQRWKSVVSINRLLRKITEHLVG